MNTIVIADDHPLTLAGTASFVQNLGYQIKAMCNNGISAYNSITLHNPELALLDINMPGMDGLDVLQVLADRRLRTRVILLTMHNEYDIYQKAKDLGVWGYVIKEEAMTELKPCIESVLKGEHWASNKLINQHSAIAESRLNDLTMVEQKIIDLVKGNKSTKQIADLLFISEKTVEKHRSRIIEKLNLPKEKNALLHWAIQNSAKN